MSDSLRSCNPARLLCPWNFPGKNTGVGWHFLLQGIFPTPGIEFSSPHLLHWQADSLPLCHLGSPTRLLEKSLRYKSVLMHIFFSCFHSMHIFTCFTCQHVYLEYMFFTDMTYIFTCLHGVYYVTCFIIHIFYIGYVLSTCLCGIHVLLAHMIHVFYVAFLFFTCFMWYNIFPSKKERANCWSSAWQSSMSFLLFLAPGQLWPPFENIDLWVHFSQA